MHSFKPVSLVRIDPLEVELSQLEDPYYIPKPFQLTIDGEPGIYIYEMSFQTDQGVPVRYRGVVGKLGVGDHDTSGDVVDPEYLRDHEAPGKHLLAHEMTFGVGTRTRHDPRDAWGPVWLLCDVEEFEGLLELEGTLVTRVTDSRGTHHRMFQLHQHAQIAAIADLISRAQLTVADGHHRIRNAIEGLGSRTRDSSPNRSEFITFVSPAAHTAELIHPIHRAYSVELDQDTIFKEVSASYDLEGISPQEVLEDRDHPVLVTPAGCFRLTTYHPSDETPIDVRDPRFTQNVADAEILGELWKTELPTVHYRFSVSEILELVRTREANLGLICRSVSTERIRAAAAHSNLLPPKSTLFHPKPLAALMLQEASGATDA